MSRRLGRGWSVSRKRGVGGSKSRVGVGGCVGRKWRKKVGIYCKEEVRSR